jgi:hypothetical protein
LACAFEAGYPTSVSIEPILDYEGIFDLILTVEPLVTNAIWLGKMNHIKNNLVIDSAEMEAEINRIENGQTKEGIILLYELLRDHSKIKWKTCMKRIIGLPVNEEPGLDI